MIKKRDQGGKKTPNHRSRMLLKKITFKKGSLPNCSMSFTWSVDCIQGSYFSFIDKLIKINLAWLLYQLCTVSDNCSFSKWHHSRQNHRNLLHFFQGETFFRDENQELILNQRSLRYNFMWKVTSVHQNKPKIFEAILSSPRNIGGFQVCQAEPGSDDGRLQTH